MGVALVMSQEVVMVAEVQYAPARNRPGGIVKAMEAVGLVRQIPAERAPVPDPQPEIKLESPVL